MKFILISSIIILTAFAHAMGDSFDFAKHHNDVTGFNSFDYLSKANFGMGYTHKEMDDDANETAVVNAFIFQTNSILKEGNETLFFVNFSLVQGFYRWGHTMLTFDALCVDKSALIDNYSRWFNVGLGYFTSPDGTSFIEMGLTPSIGMSRIKTGGYFYKDLDLYTELDYTGWDFALKHDLIFNTYAIDLKFTNEIQAIAGTDAIFFYRLKGRLDINLGDYSDDSSTKFTPFAEYVHERAFIENYKQFNDYLRVGIDLFY